MLEALFRRPYHLHRLRANPLGAVLDSFVQSLVRRGHAKTTVHQLLRAAEHYGRWLGIQYAVVTVEHITPASARKFLLEHLPRCSCASCIQRGLIPSRTATNHLLRMLAEREPARVPQPCGPHGPILAKYKGFLERDCGLSQHTRIFRLRYAREFLLRHLGDAPLDSKRMNTADLQEYFRRHAGLLKSGSVAVLASSLRSLLRLLALSHGFSPALSASVPMAPQWPMDRLPKALTESELQAILAHVGTDVPTGRRNFEMIRCMSDVGFRVSEVVALTLDDIDWRGGTLTVRSGKGGRGRILPMPPSLGQAICA